MLSGTAGSACTSPQQGPDLLPMLVTAFLCGGFTFSLCMHGFSPELWLSPGCTLPLSNCQLG